MPQSIWISCKQSSNVYINKAGSFGKKKNQGALNKADFYDKVWCYSHWILMTPLVKQKERKYNVSTDTKS